MDCTEFYANFDVETSLFSCEQIQQHKGRNEHSLQSIYQLIRQNTTPVVEQIFTMIQTRLQEQFLEILIIFKCSQQPKQQFYD
jgi:hypothetical protein